MRKLLITLRFMTHNLWVYISSHPPCTPHLFTLSLSLKRFKLFSAFGFFLDLLSTRKIGRFWGVVSFFLSILHCFFELSLCELFLQFCCLRILGCEDSCLCDALWFQSFCSVFRSGFLDFPFLFIKKNKGKLEVGMEKTFFLFCCECNYVIWF